MTVVHLFDPLTPLTCLYIWDIVVDEILRPSHIVTSVTEGESRLFVGMHPPNNTTIWR